MGNAFVLLFASSYVFGSVDSFVLYSLICASERTLFMDDENILKKTLQIKCVLRLLVGLLVHVLHMCY